MTRDEQWLLNEKYGGERSEAFFADCARLAAGEPLAYLIGWVPFLDCKIWLSSEPSLPPIPSSDRHRESLSGGRTGINAKKFALIPRPETEHWTERAIAAIQAFQGPSLERIRVLDLCAGSGCIGVAVAKAVPEAQIDFAEADLAHHPTIQRNLEENGIDAVRTRIFPGDLFERIEERYDFILTNPPYIDPALDRTDASVRAFEPHSALYGGAGGAELIRRVIGEAPRHLTEQGQLWLEHEPEHADAIGALAEKSCFLGNTHSDQYGVKRYSVLVLLA